MHPPFPSPVRGIEDGLPSQRRAQFEEGGKPNPEQAERVTCVKDPGRQGLYCRAEQHSHVPKLSTDDRMITDGSGEIGCNQTSVS